MAKKLTQSKAKKILHDKSVHGKPLTEKQRKFFGAIAGGAKPYIAEDGTLLQKREDNYGVQGNYNDYNISLPKGFKGWAYNLKGRNYSPAWGGQFQMGGSLPGTVGFMYARTQSPAPSNGPYAKKTKASAQNGQEMKYYQEGLDFTPKTISQDGSEIPVDPMGYWNAENVGNPVIIPSNIITMEGVDQPLVGISDTGDVQYMEPGGNYTFDGNYVTEYPMAKGGVSVNKADESPIKKLNQLLNFTNNNNMAKAKHGKSHKKAQTGMQTGTMPRTAIPDIKQMNAQGLKDLTAKVSSTPTATKAPTNAMPYIQAGVDVIQGLSMIKEQRDAVRKAKQMAKLTGVQAQAVASKRVQPIKNKYVFPWDVIRQPQQMSPSYGVGTNILAQDGSVIRNNIGGNPTEIMNVYNPGTMYTDLGYEPLNDTSKMKQFLAGGKMTKAQGGFEAFMTGGGGADLTAILERLAQGEAPEAGNKIGKGIGTAAGTALFGPVGGMVGGLIGGALGGAIDTSEERIKMYQDESKMNVGNILGQETGASIQSENSSILQDGGTTSPYKWVSHTWQPQVIATFGEHKLSSLLKPPADADMLRAGGHLKEYTPPSPAAMSTERPDMQLGGELQTHWGGYAEPMSYNPYMPGTGETVMFRGQSHDESDGRGNTGIGITYGDNPVEVERGEPMFEMEEGGEIDPLTGEPKKSGIVLGNVKITSALADMLADPKAKGKKFKTYGADLSKQENKQNKLMEKSIDQLDNLNVQNSFDKLALGTLQANMEGANAKLKDLAEKKMNAAALQSAVHKVRDEDKLVKITDKGDILAKKGANIPKAQDGISRGKSRAELANVDPAIKGLFDLLGKKNYDVFATSGYRDSTTKSGKPSRHSKGEAMDITFPELGEKAYEAVLNDPDIAQYMLQNNITAINEYDPETQKLTGATGPHIHFGFDKGTPLADKFRTEAASKYPDALTPISQSGLPQVSPEDFNYLKGLYEQASKEPGKRGPAVLRFQQEFHRIAPDYAKKVLSQYPVTSYGKKKGLEASDLSQNLDSIFGQRTERYMAALNAGMGDTPVGDMSSMKTLQEAILPPGKKTLTKKDMQSFTVNPYKRSLLMDAFNQVLPYLRPSDIEELDPSQLIGEMYALSQNQVEPVWAQKFTPELSTPIDISLQDILNENQATYNATARQTGYNPEALGILNAQKYQANQRVLGEQFRLNQTERQRVYEQNRNLLNQANLQNLQTLERQADKQAMALSKTKATTQEALNSIASKYAQNKLQNRTLAVMENMYNYRYSPSFRAMNMNPLWQPNIQDVGGAVPIYDKNNKVIGYKSIEEATGVEKPSLATPGITAKSGKAVKKINLNSSVVKALKNI